MYLLCQRQNNQFILEFWDFSKPCPLNSLFLTIPQGRAKFFLKQTDLFVVSEARFITIHHFHFRAASFFKTNFAYPWGTVKN